MNESLETIYREHRQGLFSLAVAVTGSHQIAEDAVQNAFASMFGRSVPDDPVAYVYRSVRNAAIDLCRSANRQSTLKESLINGYSPNPSAGPAPPPDELLTKERHERLRSAIDWLSDVEQEAIVLKAFADLTFDQAGKVASVPAKTIATRYRRALEKLESRLQDER